MILAQTPFCHTNAFHIDIICKLSQSLFNFPFDDVGVFSSFSEFFLLLRKLYHIHFALTICFLVVNLLFTFMAFFFYSPMIVFEEKRTRHSKALLNDVFFDYSEPGICYLGFFYLPRLFCLSFIYQDTPWRSSDYPSAFG